MAGPGYYNRLNIRKESRRAIPLHGSDYLAGIRLIAARSGRPVPAYAFMPGALTGHLTDEIKADPATITTGCYHTALVKIEPPFTK